MTSFATPTPEDSRAITAPIPVRVLRYRCPHCSKSYSRPVRTREHMARCWQNPQARGCKTCKHFEPYGPGDTESCAAGISLDGRPACSRCGGSGLVPFTQFDATECEECGGDAAEIKPGPIVHCHEWQLRTEEGE